MTSLTLIHAAIKIDLQTAWSRRKIKNRLYFQDCFTDLQLYIILREEQFCISRHKSEK